MRAQCTPCAILVLPVLPRRPAWMQAGRSIESIFAELAAAGLVRLPPPTCVADFLGGDRMAEEVAGGAAPQPAQPSKPKAGGKKNNASAPGQAAKAPAGKAKTAAGEDEFQPYPEHSLAQGRQAVVASCVLPLGAHPALSK